MKHILFISAVVALSYAQSFQSEPPSSIIGVPGPRWHGPLANHVPGQLVSDTSAVAEAKIAHYKAHEQILAILPILPPEERYRTSGYVQQPIQQNFPSQQPQYHNIQPQYHNIQPQSYSNEPKITQFAEDVPRSELGETPEVYAARVAHLKALEDIKKQLPKLETTYQTRVENPINVQQQWRYNPVQQAQVNVYPTDTPEVAAARQEHLRLLAAAQG